MKDSVTIMPPDFCESDIYIIDKRNDRVYILPSVFSADVSYRTGLATTEVELNAKSFCSMKIMQMPNRLKNFTEEDILYLLNDISDEKEENKT